jgi:hypothetical protein
MEQAQLITPQGERIILPPYIYAKMMEVLAVDRPPPAMTRAEVKRLVAETYGILKGKVKQPLTEALLESRREELEREEREIREWQRRSPNQ